MISSVCWSFGGGGAGSGWLFCLFASGGATANQLPNPVPEEVKQERLSRLMELQATVSADRLRRKIDRTMTVLVDGIDDEGTVYCPLQRRCAGDRWGRLYRRRCGTTYWRVYLGAIVDS